MHLAAVCEKCGAIGVKHAFYGKERKFCSLSCARGPLPPPHHHGEGHGETEEDTGQSLLPGNKVSQEADGCLMDHYT